MKKTLGVFLAAILALSVLSPMACQASVSSTEEFLFYKENVVSAGFFEMSTVKAPGTAYVISKADIAASPARTMGQLLDLNVPGVVIGHHQRQGELYGTRGVMIDNNAKTLFLWDGQNLNKRMHFGYMSPLLLPFLGDIETVEVINGPGAIVHGSGAINGFVNMTPKTGTTSPGLFTKAEFGARESLYKAEAGYGKAYGDKKDIFVYAGYVVAKGRPYGNSYGVDLDPATSNLVNQSHPEWATDRKVYGFRPSYKFDTVWNHGDFNLNVLHQVDNNQTSAFDDRGVWGYQQRYFYTSELALRPKYTVRVGEKDAIEFTMATEINDHADRSVKSGTYNGGGEYHVEGKALYKTTSIDKHSFAMGTLYGKRQFRDRKAYLSENPRDGFESINMRWNEFGVFAEDIYQPTDQWTMSLGARYDKVFYRDAPSLSQVPKDVDHTSPRVAAAYQINPETVVKASYQNGFRTPDAMYLSWKPAWDGVLRAVGSQTLYPDFKPETMDSWELNLHRNIRSADLLVDLNLYYNTYRDTLLWYSFAEGDGFFAPGVVNGVIASNGWFQGFVNTKGKFSSIGSELVGTWQPGKNTCLRGSYSYSQPKAMTDRENLGWANSNKTKWARYNPHIVKLNGTRYLMEKKLALNLSGLYAGSIDSKRIGRNYLAKPRIVIDAAATYDVNKTYSVKAIGQNLTHNVVPPPSTQTAYPWRYAIGTDERFYYLELSAKF